MRIYRIVLSVLMVSGFTLLLKPKPCARLRIKMDCL